jgi:ApbE superfamily uncharacterized protein (UPF0280 family)
MARMSAVRARLDDGRLHLQHGPIDVIVQCWGATAEAEAAYEQAWGRFQTILDELVAELAELRKPLGDACPSLHGSVARRMVEAVWPHRAQFITPMAAVAGAVADELMDALLKDRSLQKAYVNDGGDIALHLTPDEDFKIGIVDDVLDPAVDAKAIIDYPHPARGIATSGWRGRSQSLGIADAATVLARSAAAADAAATLVANAVNVEHPAIRRLPARAVREESDLGELPVTVEVGRLPEATVRAALESGTVAAQAMRAAGLLHGAYLSLQGRSAVH